MAKKPSKSSGKATAGSKTTGKAKATKAKKKQSAKAGKPYALVIVESPAKAKTIGKYLGSSYYEVTASMGHVRDLPSKKMGVDSEKDFEPTYQNLPSRKELISKLSRAAKGAERVFLATDMDREGEAIAWHVAQALKIPAEKTSRVVFNEITKRAINEAFEAAGQIDKDKVDAQQARRILDRMVGYELSPLL